MFSCRSSAQSRCSSGRQVTFRLAQGDVFIYRLGKSRHVSTCLACACILVVQLSRSSRWHCLGACADEFIPSHVHPRFGQRSCFRSHLVSITAEGYTRSNADDEMSQRPGRAQLHLQASTRLPHGTIILIFTAACGSHLAPSPHNVF
jgi:hypothetical protein